MPQLQERLRKGLEKERKDLTTQILEMEKLASEPGYSPSLVTTLVEIRTEIDAALAKFADGRYGRCEACAGEIGDARLEKLPAARWCIECAANDGKPSKKKKPAAAKPTAAPAKAKTAPAKPKAAPAKAAPAKPAKPAKTAPSKAASAPAESSMSVWLDQDNCEGHGKCVKACPTVFTLHKGKAYVTEGKKRLAGHDGLAKVPPASVDAVIKAADRCPTSAIYIEAE